jgi:hypothetical protein
VWIASRNEMVGPKLVRWDEPDNYWIERLTGERMTRNAKTIRITFEHLLYKLKRAHLGLGGGRAHLGLGGGGRRREERVKATINPS